MMRLRRRVLLGVTLGILAGPLSAHGQSGRIPKIGVLSPGPPPQHGLALLGFREGLRELGYVEGRDVVLEYRYAEWKYDRLSALAAELVQLKPDVIFLSTNVAALAAKRATTTIPIVIGAAGDLVEHGLVASLARPGGNITGMTLLYRELDRKRLELLKEAVPKVSRVAILVNPANPGQRSYPQGFADLTRTLGIRIDRVEASSPAQLDGAFSTMAKLRADALLMANDSMLHANRNRIGDLISRHRLPSISENREFAAEARGLLAYGPSIFDMGRRAAAQVDKILKGAKPADLPVEQPSKFTLVVNLRTAKALGLTIPQSVLFRADETIQ